ncbi:hypothetical protein EVAR_10095_1 [Eumeta japonica]|uniref:Uncharacterized protein n=1 Tax=Eumeta variegata TaxID=151549 RepID=A0A4C1UDJ6_EUMVA|nr:hypothetical protein EVAR_10095_1 [Eumeta japonica]
MRLVGDARRRGARGVARSELVEIAPSMKPDSKFLAVGLHWFVDTLLRNVTGPRFAESAGNGEVLTRTARGEAAIPFDTLDTLCTWVWVDVSPYTTHYIHLMFSCSGVLCKANKRGRPGSRIRLAPLPQRSKARVVKKSNTVTPELSLKWATKNIERGASSSECILNRQPYTRIRGSHIDKHIFPYPPIILLVIGCTCFDIRCM